MFISAGHFLALLSLPNQPGEKVSGPDPVAQAGAHLQAQGFKVFDHLGCDVK